MTSPKLAAAAVATAVAKDGAKVQSYNIHKVFFSLYLCDLPYMIKQMASNLTCVN